MNAFSITLCLVLTLFVPVTAASQEFFTLKSVTPTVYLALAGMRAVANSNAVIVILNDGVLVVDSHSRPSVAKSLISEIRKITSKPVRYVVDSHFHWDHAQGNSAYVSAWPLGTEIISTEATRFDLEHIGKARLRSDVVTMTDTLAKWRRQLSTTSDSAARSQLAGDIADLESYINEIKSLELALPTLTFEHTLTLRHGAQVVQVLFLGRGHTDGDAVVYLPSDRIVITGDLVHGYAPFIGDCYPYDWIQTLDELEKLDFDTILSAHGDALTGKGQLRLYRDLLKDLMHEVELGVAKGLSKETLTAEVAPLLRSRFGSQFALGSLEWYLVPSIEKAWSVVAMPVK